MAKLLQAHDHPIYDKLHVNDRSTRLKVMEEFANSVSIERSGLPKVLEFVHRNENFDSKMLKTSEKVCPNCLIRGTTTHVASPLIDGTKTWVAECPKCKTAINFFTPTPLQKLIGTLNAKVINVISGYGSGKTEFDMYMVSKKAITLDGAKILVASGTSVGLATAKGFLNKHFARPYKSTKERSGDFIIQNESLWKLKNGSEIR